jgi:hypothetical protein
MSNIGRIVFGPSSPIPVGTTPIVPTKPLTEADVRRIVRHNEKIITGVPLP